MEDELRVGTPDELVHAVVLWLPEEQPDAVALTVLPGDSEGAEEGEPDEDAVPVGAREENGVPLSMGLTVALSEEGAEGEGGGKLDGNEEREGEPLPVELSQAEAVGLSVPLPEVAPVVETVAVAATVPAAAPTQPPPSQKCPRAHTGRAARRVQCAPAAAALAWPTHAPPARTKVEPPLVTANTASDAHAAGLVPWQARLFWLHVRPSEQSVAARGTTGGLPEPLPARAPSHELHTGAAAMPSALAEPR